MTPAANAFAAPQILVVDDDVALRGAIADYLSQHGYEVIQAGDATAMERALAVASIDLIVLDLMLPGEDGLSICRRIADGGGPAIIMLSAMGEEIDRILGLELGADDYLAKPCSPRELLARVRAVLRRREEVRTPGPVKGKACHFLGFTLDQVRRQLRAPNGVSILLTAGEFSLLSVFLDHPQRILSRDELIERARGGEADVFDRAIDVQISRLRRKLHDCAPDEVIKTYRGAGYLFDAKVTRS
ncbi:response regulator [Phenylobacterium sp.]|uniref:response regulator n=1 Tax=Phenylobacterium sp. TaxID=1871053 RepID=UPI00272610EE|nr:response regulator [Phenylobacterium sp.]MDO8800717.1 response regulator [Phenylobacterium sp.]